MSEAQPKIEGDPYEYQPWPKWCVDADGNGDIFESEAEVPDGWSIDGKVKGGSPFQELAPSDFNSADATFVPPPPAADTGAPAFLAPSDPPAPIDPPSPTVIEPPEPTGMMDPPPPPPAL